MSEKTDHIDAYIEEYFHQYVNELNQFCAQPSVSATGRGIQKCALLVKSLLETHGLEAQSFETAGNPVVVGKAKGISKRTLLFYNHYDVQPPEPLDLWTSPPFEPTVRDGNLYARGAADDKGELIARLAALDAVRSANGGTLPCAVTFVVEGDEEIGSPNIAKFVKENLDLLQCDAAIWEGGGITPDGRPANTLGVRGILGVELSVETMKRDAHSGSAHMLPSAAWRLLRALVTLKDKNELVLIPGFYDSARAPSELDLKLLKELPGYESVYKDQYEMEAFVLGRTGNALKRAVFKPTCNIQGVTTGYQGKGLKTVIPANASAKLDFRLIPDQDPEDILVKLREHLDTEGFEDVQVNYLGAMWPAKTSADDPFVRLTSATGEDVYERPALLTPLGGGSTPIYAFSKPLGDIPVIFAGASYWDNRIHAPDEHIRLDDLKNGARHIARILDGFASI